jgi:hypothetical protein
MPNGQNIHRKEGAERWGVDPSDGFYVAMTAEQRIKMNDIRRERTVAKDEQDEPEAVTAEWIADELADLQLAAALTTMTKKLDSGKWEPVGPGDATIQIHLSQKVALENQMERYLERVGEIEKELKRIDRIIAGAEPAEETQATDEQGKLDATDAERVEAVEEEATP